MSAPEVCGLVGIKIVWRFYVRATKGGITTPFGGETFGEFFNSDEKFKDALLYATGRGAASNKRLEIMEQIFNEALND